MTYKSKKPKQVTNEPTHEELMEHDALLLAQLINVVYQVKKLYEEKEIQKDGSLH